MDLFFLLPDLIATFVLFLADTAVWAVWGLAALVAASYIRAMLVKGLPLGKKLGRTSTAALALTTYGAALAGQTGLVTFCTRFAWLQFVAVMVGTVAILVRAVIKRKKRNSTLVHNGTVA